MNFIIYRLAGVKKPEVSPDALQELASKWRTVRRSATASREDVQATIEEVLLANEGEASDAFHTQATGGSSSLQQLDRLADAATATAEAHAAAASAVRTVQTAMDSVANRAFREMLKAALLEPSQRVRRLQQVLQLARTNLTMLSVAANAHVTAIYASVSLPEQMPLAEAQTRGSVPAELEALWSSMSDEDKRRFLLAMADDFTKDWDDDQPTITFYSVDNPDPPDVMPPPANTDWGGLNGVRNANGVWINNDQLNPPDWQSETTLMSTMIHELQHEKQSHLNDRYDRLVSDDPDLVADVRAGRRVDPFVADGSTLDEVERFKTPYKSSQVEEEKPFYTHQPVEMDARRGGTEYLDNLTPEKVEELLG